MKSARNVPWFSTAVCVMAVLVYLGGASWEGRLVLEREAGWVRFVPALWTCHWVHASAAHLALNVLAAAIALGWLELSSRRLAITTVVMSAPLVALSALWAMPEIARYCGLSGVIHAAAGALIALAFFRGHRGVALLALLVGALKLGWEFRAGASLFLGQGDGSMVSTPAAHLAGLLCGVVVGTLHETFVERQLRSAIGRS